MDNGFRIIKTTANSRFAKAGLSASMKIKCWFSLLI